MRILWLLQWWATARAELTTKERSSTLRTVNFSRAKIFFVDSTIWIVLCSKANPRFSSFNFAGDSQLNLMADFLLYQSPVFSCYRGDNIDFGHRVTPVVFQSGRTVTDGNAVPTSPTEIERSYGDMLITYSTLPGSIVYRDFSSLLNLWQLCYSLNNGRICFISRRKRRYLVYQGAQFNFYEGCSWMPRRSSSANSNF